MRHKALGYCWVALLLACSGCYASRSDDALGGETHFLACERDADCSELSGDYSCHEGQCMTAEQIAQVAPDDGQGAGEDSSDSSTASGEGSGAGANGSNGAGDAANTLTGVEGMAAPAASAPLVMFLVDTSGSMERRNECECETAACTECLPDCTVGDRSRWIEVLEILTGGFDGYACEAIERDFGLRVYDTGYYLPYHRPSGVQRADGVLDRYASEFRFGVATFDGQPTYYGQSPLVPSDTFEMAQSLGVEGLWSYDPTERFGVTRSAAPIGEFSYPYTLVDYRMDTGIRSPEAQEGGVRVATDQASAIAINAEIQRSLLRVRPYGGTPIAASLDDLRYYFALDSGATALHGSPRHIVYIADGYPDDDYRKFGCDCHETDDPNSTNYCMGDSESAPFRCPYPTAQEAAAALVCQQAADCDPGSVDALHLVGHGIRDPEVRDELNQLAVAAGTGAARYTDDAASLSAALDSILQEILAANP